MIELRVLRGPLGDKETRAIVDLYGPADRKYEDPQFARHQFAKNAYGWTLHAFASDDGRAVGHCALLPIPARAGAETVVSGKFEALAVLPEYQSSTLADGRLVGLGLLAELYERAGDEGFALLHDLAQPELGLMHRMHGARRVPVPWQTFVGVGDRRQLRALSAGRAVAGTALAYWQRAAQRASIPLSGRARVRAATPGDEPPPPHEPQPGTWTIEAADMWEWLVGSGLLAWVEEPSGGRALVRVPGPAAQAAELLDWRPGRRGLAGAVATITAIARLGREGRSVRIANPSGDDDLRRAAHLLGLLPAREPLMLYVKSLRADIDATNVTVTPFFFATF
jgi:hypothetical protein